MSCSNARGFLNHIRDIDVFGHMQVTKVLNMMLEVAEACVKSAREYGTENVSLDSILHNTSCITNRNQCVLQSGSMNMSCQKFLFSEIWHLGVGTVDCFVLG